MSTFDLLLYKLKRSTNQLCCSTNRETYEKIYSHIFNLLAEIHEQIKTKKQIDQMTLLYELFINTNMNPYKNNTPQPIENIIQIIDIITNRLSIEHREGVIDESTHKTIK